MQSGAFVCGGNAGGGRKRARHGPKPSRYGGLQSKSPIQNRVAGTEWRMNSAGGLLLAIPAWMTSTVTGGKFNGGW